MKKQSFVLLVLILALAMGASTPRTQTRVNVPEAVAARAAAGDTFEVIVGVNATFTPEGALNGPAAIADQRAAMTAAVSDVAARAASVGVQVGRRFESIPFFVATVNRATLEALATTAGVTSISENGVREISLTQSPTIVNAPPAWSAGATGAGWKVAVLDTGVQTSHPFIGTARTYSEACYSGGGGGSNQSLCPGGATSSTAVGSAQGCVGVGAGVSGCNHGTHVAGIALGSISGVAGIAPGAQLIAVQVFTRRNSGCSSNPCLGAYDADIIGGLERVLALAGTNNVNKVASVNMSLGGQQHFSTCDAQNPAMTTAINNLKSIGIATVVASGNNGFASSMSFPACISSAVSVGATSKTPPYNIASFSNDATFLSLAAPGVGILSSVPVNGAASFNGTSMAAPHVAGAWAVIKQAVPTVSVDTALATFRATATNVLEPFTGRTQKMINVNAARLALAVAGGPPGAPTGFAATVNGNSVSMGWTAPSTGGAPQGYQLIVRGTPGGAVLTTFNLGLVTSFGPVATPNGAYALSVRAGNPAGYGPESNVATFTVPTLPPAPGAPTGLAANVAGSQVGFTWTPPASGGPVVNYVLLAGSTPGFTTPLATLVLPPSPASYAISAPAGTWYARIYARNAGGNSGVSNEVQFVVAPPGAPTLNVPVVTGNNVQLSWSPGTGAPTSYTLLVSATSGGAPFMSAPMGAATSTSIPSVPNGTYYLRLVAHNALGASPPSNQRTLVVPAP